MLTEEKIECKLKGNATGERGPHPGWGLLPTVIAAAP